MTIKYQHDRVTHLDKRAVVHLYLYVSMLNHINNALMSD